MEVFKRREKVERSLSVSGLRSRVLRIFRASTELQAPDTHDEIFGEDRYHVHPSVIKGALLDAEQKRAMAVMEWERHPRLY